MWLVQTDKTIHSSWAVPKHVQRESKYITKLVSTSNWWWSCWWSQPYSQILTGTSFSIFIFVTLSINIHFHTRKVKKFYWKQCWTSQHCSSLPLSSLNVSSANTRYFLPQDFKKLRICGRDKLVEMPTRMDYKTLSGSRLICWGTCKSCYQLQSFEQTIRERKFVT